MPNNRDTISIIVPVYKVVGLLDRCVASVTAQTYQNWEVIFVDDCSRDDTIRRISAIKDKDNRIRLYQNRSNLGAALSRNNALREAKGRWVAFLDSDDLWEPTKLEKQVRFMEENGYAFSYTE